MSCDDFQTSLHRQSLFPHRFIGIWKSPLLDLLPSRMSPRVKIQLHVIRFRQTDNSLVLVVSFISFSIKICGHSPINPIDPLEHRLSNEN